VWNVATVVSDLGSAAEHLDTDTATCGYLVINSDVRIFISNNVHFQNCLA